MGRPGGRTLSKRLEVREVRLEGLVGKIGENIRVRRFARFQTGEGLEKRSTDLAADVQAALGGQ